MEGYNIEKEMREAIEAGENALYSLRAAKEELRKAGNWGIADLLGGDFLTFADFFWDGGVADWLVQSKINEARSQVEQAIPQVEQILSNLKRY